MPAPTTALVAKQALIDALQARLVGLGIGGGNVQVTYGFVLAQLEQESIAVGRIEWETEDWAAFGNRRKEERYYIELYVWVQRKGDTQKQATERAGELLGQVEMHLRETPIISAINWQEFEPVSINEAPAKEGMQTMAEARVHVIARK